MLGTLGKGGNSLKSKYNPLLVQLNFYQNQLCLFHYYSGHCTSAAGLSIYSRDHMAHKAQIISNCPLLLVSINCTTQWAIMVTYYMYVGVRLL